jgi:hypothetical protein
VTTEELADCRWHIQFAADYSSRYHRRRSAFLTSMDKLLTLITVAAGATAFGDLVAGSPSWLSKVGAALVTLLSLFQALLGIGPAGMLHGQWLKRWSRLLTSINLNTDPTLVDVRAWMEEKAAIEEECIAELRALQIDCEDASARFYEVQGRQHRIEWWQRMLFQVGTFQQEFPIIPDRSPPLPSPAS